MVRYAIVTFLGLLIFTTGSFAQPFPGRRPPKSPPEARVIAEYWVHSYLRRNVKPGEVEFWAHRILKNRSPAGALSEFLAIPEYYNYAGDSRRGFIRQLIMDVGHREASRFELEDLLRATAGLSLQNIAHYFLRANPQNWWPGPAATPPNELKYFYRRFHPGPVFPY